MDLKYALRSLRKNPGFTALAVIVMALGIGANTAVFSVVNGVLLKPLAYQNPERLVTLSPLNKKSGKSGGNSSAPDFHDWHDQSNAFDAMAIYDWGSIAVVAASGAEYAQAAQISPEFFNVFGATPVVGRMFTAQEWKDGSAAVISQSYWQSHFNGKADALGSTVRMYGKAFTIVGVMAAGFDFPEKSQLWSAQTPADETPTRTAHNYRVVGRLKEGVSLSQAQAQMALIGDRLEKEHPDEDRNKGVAVTGMRDGMIRDVRMTLYLLLGAVGMVLLISCANMANLLLARATSRTREMAIRAAMGAGRARIIRQLILESAVLALVAGTVGLLLALWGAQALVAIAPVDVPRLAEAGVIDKSVLAFTFAISLVASLLFGLAPALTASRVDLNDALKSNGGRAVVGGGAAKLRSVLVVAEIALSVVLLAGAGLLIKSFLALNTVSLGYKADHLLIMSSNAPVDSVETGQKAAQFYKALQEDVASLPGVTAVGATRNPPGRAASNGTFFVDRLPEHISSNPDREAVFSLVAPRTFATLGIPLIHGRDFSDGDSIGAPYTVIINEALAKKAFAGQDPLGHVLFCGFLSMKTPMTIIGVVGDVRQFGPATAPWPEMFLPNQQYPRANSRLSLLVRTATDPAAMSETLRRMVRDRAPEIPVKFTTMEASLAENVAAPRFRTLLFVVFAGLAVCLAMAGVYGVMAYVVGQRLSEIGLRMALGASQADVLKMVMKQGLTLAATGIVLGLAAAVAATRLLTSFLFEVKPGDPLTYFGVAVVLALVAMAACFLPARRATQVDPLVALRQE